MRLKYIIPIFACIALLLSACTKNNGPSDILYGEWKIESMTFPNGSDFYRATDDHAFFLAFQSTTARLTKRDGEDYMDCAYGNWEQNQEAKTLIISFPDKRWQPWKGCGFTGIEEGDIEVPNRFNIALKSSDKLVLVNMDEPYLTYTLVKW